MFSATRRTFFKTSFLTSVIVISSSKKLFGVTTPLQTLRVVQNDLFPHADALGVNASEYFTLILRHSKITEEDKSFLQKGVKWLNEEAMQMYKKVYTSLTAQQRQSVLQKIAKERWGENWIHRVLVYIMEAVLGDPIYGINKNEAGWKWLGHQSGQPQPKEAYL